MVNWDAYTKAIVEIELSDGPVTVGTRGTLCASEVQFPDGQGRTIHVITADNPDGTTHSPEANEQARELLRAELDQAGVQVFTAAGGDLTWEHTEASFAVVGLTDDEALELGRMFEQEAIFAWTPEHWELIACDSGERFQYAWGAVNGTAAQLADRADFPELTRWAAGPRMSRVSWAEVRDHLKNRLMMDDEWIVEDDESLVWWPTPLPLHIGLLSEGEFPNGDNWLHVCAETDIAYTEDESLGIEAAAAYRHRYPTGTLIYEDGWLRLCTAIALNPLGRNVLSAFHESVLIQASVALDLSVEWTEVDGLLWRDGTALAHPTSGERSDVDELVRIYGPHFRSPHEIPPRIERTTAATWAHARAYLRDNYIRQGWLQGFTNEEVDYFYADDDNLVELAIGVNPDDWRIEKFGAGVTIWGRLLPGGAAFDDHDANLMNIALIREFPLTVLGHITGGEGEKDRGSILNAYLPFNPWAEYASRGPADMAVAVGNVAAASGMVSRTFRRWFDEMAADTEGQL